jgi:trigger factor
MLKRKQESAQHAFEDAVIDVLTQNVEGEIPECMYENKAKENIDSFAQRVGQQGIDLNTYLMYMGMDMATFEGQMRERAVADVKIELAVEKIIELEGDQKTISTTLDTIKQLMEWKTRNAEEISYGH